MNELQPGLTPTSVAYWYRRVRLGGNNMDLLRNHLIVNCYDLTVYATRVSLRLKQVRLRVLAPRVDVASIVTYYPCSMQLGSDIATSVSCYGSGLRLLRLRVEAVREGCCC